MKTENWKIGYDMQHEGRVVHLEENLKPRLGYHSRLGRHWKQGDFPDNMRTPICKFRDNNYVQLLFHGGLTLPLESRADLEGAVLLCNPEHPIELTAPNGRKYSYSE
ncbi:MAG: hypothetical protein PHF67_02105 [Candidatus Nanoarchaeia archaeon]|nr:hypothetical protein [Candidatus Nanoarchaeia archaeon]